MPILSKNFRFAGFYARSKGILDKIHFRQQYSNFFKLKSSYYKQYWEVVAYEIGADIEHVGYEFYKLTKSGKDTFVRQYEVMLDNHVIYHMAGNKPLIHRILKNNSYPVPNFCEYDLSNLPKAKEFIDNIGKDTVVKPANGSGGRGITTKVSNYKRLKKASLLAAAFGNKLIIEEEIHGSSYRLLFLDSKFIDAIRRDPPSIIGNGYTDIKTLIKQENEQRLSSKQVTALSPLTIDLDCKSTLRHKRMNLKSMPKKDDRIIVKSVINQNASRDNHVVREKVHPSIIKMGENLTAFLGIKLAGLDLIATDISIPLSDSEGLINEVNTTPGFHHHDLVSEEEKKVNVAAITLDYIFSL